jgi:hypothetical protein
MTSPRAARRATRAVAAWTAVGALAVGTLAVAPAATAAGGSASLAGGRAAAGTVVAGSVATLAARTSAYLPGTRCRAFPANNYWHTDVSRLPKHARSSQWMSHMQASSRRLHPDFGPAYGEQPVPYGIPITVVNGATRVPVRFGYAGESDRVKYPLNAATKIEGGSDAGGDRHAIVVDAATCTLFETWDTHQRASGWYAGSGAVWSLTSNKLRPRGWTSADAAGLPILPGLLRYDEVARGKVDHAIRFTTDATDRRFVWPARHHAGSVSNAAYPPMGARFRLTKGYDISGYGASAQVVLRAMKKYGLVLADNGSPWYFQGTSDTRWGSGIIEALKRVPASAFEAVDTSKLKITGGSAKARRR